MNAELVYSEIIRNGRSVITRSGAAIVQHLP